MLNKKAVNAPDTNPKIAQRTRATSTTVIPYSRTGFVGAVEESPVRANRNDRERTNSTARPHWSAAETVATISTLTGRGCFITIPLCM